VKLSPPAAPKSARLVPTDAGQRSVGYGVRPRSRDGTLNSARLLEVTLKYLTRTEDATQSL